MLFFPTPLKTALAALLLCLAATVPVMAGGRSERATRERLAQAETLIDERQYNEAILLLTRIVKDDPEAFDAAEKLMQRIRAVRGQYNEKYQELIVALFENNDVERALELIRDLQGLDPNLTASTLGDVIEDTEIVVALNRFREIMNEARELLRQERYRDAVDKYMEGFDLGSESLQDAGGGDIEVSAVAGAVSRLRSAVPAFFEASDSLDRTISGLSTGSGQPAAAERLRQADAVKQLLRSLAGQRGTVERSGELFRTQSDQVRARNAQLMEADRKRKLELFLSIASRLVFGRENEPPEGIATALTAVWLGGYTDAGASFARPGDAAISQGVALYSEGRFAESRTALAGAGEPLRLTLDIQSLWPLAVHPGAALRLTGDSVAAAREHLPGFLLTQVKLEEARDTEALIGIVSGLPELEARKVGSAPEIEAAVRELRPLGTALDNLADPWRDGLQRQRTLLSEGVPVQSAVERTAAVLNRIEGARERVAGLEDSYVGTLALRRGSDLERRYEAAQKEFERGKELQDGREVALPAVTDASGRVVESPVRVEKFPREALAIYSPLESAVRTLLEETRSVVAGAGSSEEYLKQNPEVATQVARLRDLEGEVSDLGAALTERLARARRDAAEAASYRREGLDNRDEAENRLRAERYADALDSVARAQTALDNSLAVQEDAEVRRIRDRDLPGLVRRIKEAGNRDVVVEVRRLIEQAKNLYRQGDFNGAQQSLIQARRLWEGIGLGENPEITLWLGFVQAALAASTGREIPETNPLYGEMNQLYNQAVGEFDEGRRLLPAGGNQFQVHFNRARDKLTQILKFFPYNQRARLLGLRIDQVGAPDKFKDKLDTLFREAVARARVNPTEAYADLKDIQAILPTYPGLERALYDVEVALGIRLPPPDPAKLAEARRLYDVANTIFRQRRVADYPTAIDYVNQAIVLNPDFREAIVLKDNLQVAGGAPSTILTSDDQRRLKQAEEEFLKGNYVIAGLIVDDLLKKPQYRNLQQLLELKQRIQSRL